MLASSASSSWDVFAFGIPLLALLFFGFFKLDQVFAGRKQGRPLTRRPPPPVERSEVQMQKFETAMQSDPDGRSWDERRTPRR